MNIVNSLTGWLGQIHASFPFSFHVIPAELRWKTATGLELRTNTA